MAEHMKNDAARVMANCVRESLLDVVKVIRATSFADKSGDEAASMIANSVEAAAESFHRQILAELNAESADASA